MNHSGTGLVTATLMLSWQSPCRAEHDIEYVAEHIPEVAMDNRYATLPLWSDPATAESRWTASLQVAASDIAVGPIASKGPLASLAMQRALKGGWHAGAFVFYDSFALTSQPEVRPLQTLFAPQTPIERPVDAMFSGLDGTATDAGGGVFVTHRSDTRRLGQHQWVAGLLWQRVDLTDYRFDYVVAEGPQAGVSGSIDFDATYDHLVPIVGLEMPRDFNQWTFSLHGLLAWPIPRRGVAGHITGPGFEFAGDSASAGNGTHFGDPSVTIGFDITYRPARVSIDVGTLITQALLEPLVHPGIDSNWLLSGTWTF